MEINNNDNIELHSRRRNELEKKLYDKNNLKNDILILETYNFLNYIRKNQQVTKIDCVYDFWFVCSFLARIYYKKELYTQSIKNIKRSFKYKIFAGEDETMKWLLKKCKEKI